MQKARRAVLSSLNRLVSTCDYGPPIPPLPLVPPPSAPPAAPQCGMLPGNAGEQRLQEFFVDCSAFVAPVLFPPKAPARKMAPINILLIFMFSLFCTSPVARKSASCDAPISDLPEPGAAAATASAAAVSAAQVSAVRDAARKR